MLSRKGNDGYPSSCRKRLMPEPSVTGRCCNRSFEPIMPCVLTQQFTHQFFDITQDKAILHFCHQHLNYSAFPELLRLTMEAITCKSSKPAPCRQEFFCIGQPKKNHAPLTVPPDYGKCNRFKRPICIRSGIISAKPGSRFELR